MRIWEGILFIVAILIAPATIRADEPAPAGMTQLAIEPDGGPSGLVVRGADSRLQILVTGRDAAGHIFDLTTEAVFKSDPEGIVNVDGSGLLTPVMDGETKLTATVNGLSTSVSVTAAEIRDAATVDFNNQVVPIFTKLGCNGGGCHGKSSGQNGFRLSLLGFYPEDDYEFLAREDRGRRVFPAAPARSLLLQKAAGQTPHGGGKRMEPDSHEYRVLSRWISQGLPASKADAPTVTGIRCFPSDRVMQRKSSQQIAVLATFSDGRTEDVTRMALFEPNVAELASANTTGLVTTNDLAGEVAVMARYQGQVATFRATIPLGPAPSQQLPIRNFIDEAVAKKLNSLGVPASPVCDDATFLRRVSIDIAGVLPTEQQVREFLGDPDPAKRDKLIDRLLDSPEYADHFANKWNAILRNRKKQEPDAPGTLAFYDWIWNGLNENKPFDRFATEILTASGDIETSPPTVWYREVPEATQEVEDVAQLFLGIRIQCAKCHHHPFEKWSQDDYYGLAAFFSRVGRKNLAENGNAAPRDKRVFHNVGLATATNPRSGRAIKPTPLGDREYTIGEERDPRLRLADWLTSPQNPFFARSLVNRYWKHFFDRGIVEPEDDMRETNPPSNPELLDALSKSFIDSGYNLKQLVRTICRSNTYQLSALPNELNVKDKQNFSRYYPKRLSAEVLYDGLHQVTNTTQAFTGLPAGTRAMEMPDLSVATYFLKVFGQPAGDTACECERSQAANLAQSLHLLNSAEMHEKVSAATGRAALLGKDESRSTEEKVRELYRWVYAREPDAEEIGIATAYLSKHSEKPQTGWEDIVWALLNTKEFLFNH